MRRLSFSSLLYLEPSVSLLPLTPTNPRAYTRSLTFVSSRTHSGSLHRRARHRRRHAGVERQAHLDVVQDARAQEEVR